MTARIPLILGRAGAHRAPLQLRITNSFTSSLARDYIGDHIPLQCSRGLKPAFPVCFSVVRSEEHTSELQSHLNLVCRLLLEKKKKKKPPKLHLYPSCTPHT